MPTLTGNTSYRLNGVTDFKLAGFDTSWFGVRFIEGLFLWAPEDDPMRAVSITMTGSNWGVGVIRNTGNTATVMSDTTTGGSRFIDAILLHSAGNNVVTLVNTGTSLISTGIGNDRVTLGAISIEAVSTHEGNDVVKTGRGWVNTIELGNGNNAVTIGAGSAGTVTSGEGNDTITAIGEIDYIGSGRGNDRIITQGEWVGLIDAGRGADLVTVGRGGVSFLALGRDADRVILQRQADAELPVTINGGGNVSTDQDRDSDTAIFRAFSVRLNIDLGERTTVVQNSQGHFILRDIENLVGGAAGDILRGDGEDNRLQGGGGRDVLEGRAGADTLVGGAAADRFVFSDVDHSTGDDGLTDLIVDFSRAQGDRIDLRAIDAREAVGGDQAFTFIGTRGFSEIAGQLRSVQTGGRTLIEGDTDGDGAADFALMLASAQSLGAGAFLL